MSTTATVLQQTAPAERSACGVCGGDVHLVAETLVGYREDLRYAVAGCGACGARWADPLAEEPGLYEQIYEAAVALPGYWRYESYAAQVRRRRDPLRYLGRVEDVYWAVARALDDGARPGSSRPRILEIGSGLGYLTHALHRAGHDVEGVDLSAAAVARARQRFGDTRFSSPADGDRLTDGGPWDVIVACELIEHVADAAGLLAGWAEALAPGGRIILTTPNRDYWPEATVWATDLPPVHLWWFSERSIAHLARRCGLETTFVDFTEFNRTNWSTRSRVRPAPPAPLDRHGRLRVEGATAVTRLARRPLVRQVVGRLLGDRLRGGQPTHRSATLCAVLRREGETS